jgi:hypothetical protein
MNIFTKEISHKNTDSTRPCFTILQVLALNVCGLVSKLRNPDFREFISLYDIICLTETKLDNYDEVELDGYKLAYKLLPPK